MGGSVERAKVREGGAEQGAKDGRLERSDSSIPPTTITNNPFRARFARALRSSQMFGNMCSVVSSLAESGVSVYGTLTTSMAPRGVKEITGMAKGMGCEDVFYRSHTPEDVYDTLGVSSDASLGEIKPIYNDLVKKLHPDVNPDGEERMKEVSTHCREQQRLVKAVIFGQF